MVKKHKREQYTSKGERRSSKKVKLSIVQKVCMGKGLYDVPVPLPSRRGGKDD